MPIPPKTRPEQQNDYTSHEFAADTFAAYDRLREQGPLSWQPSGQSWLLTRYADGIKVLRNPAYAEPDLTEMWKILGRKLGKDYGLAVKLLGYAPFQLEGERHA